MKKIVLLALLLVALTGCSSTPVIDKSSGVDLMGDGVVVKTLTNLHPDPVRSKLYAVNYQQAGLLPVCTEVKFEEISRKRLKFSEVKTGRIYYYDHHKSAMAPFNEHLTLYFGTECNEQEMSQLSDLDQKGIEQGKALVGMSKKGVIYAIGYPPKHQTPSLDSNQWRYWSNRSNTFNVNFGSDGLVSGIQE